MAEYKTIIKFEKEIRFWCAKKSLKVVIETFFNSQSHSGLYVIDCEDPLMPEIILLGLEKLARIFMTCISINV